MARKFLYVVAVLIVLALAASFAYHILGDRADAHGDDPGRAFVGLPGTDPDAYEDREMWLARPDKPGNAALWLPPGVGRRRSKAAAVFFVHPTSYLDKSHWNAPLDNADANGRAALFLRGQAIGVQRRGEIWAPRYRQATFGAFLTDEGAAQQALDLAYRDVDTAFTRISEARPAIVRSCWPGTARARCT